MTERGASLTNYLLDLSKNPQALALFQRDPRAAAQQAGLSTQAVDALASKDATRIQQAVLDESAATDPSGARAIDRAGITVVVVIV